MKIRTYLKLLCKTEQWKRRTEQIKLRKTRVQLPEHVQNTGLSSIVYKSRSNSGDTWSNFPDFLEIFFLYFITFSSQFFQFCHIEVYHLSDSPPPQENNIHKCALKAPQTSCVKTQRISVRMPWAERAKLKNYKILLIGL